MSGLQSFEKQQYLSLETFRKNGQGVKTPVWFAQNGEKLTIWTETASGKAKRIRNNAQVKIAPSRGDGMPLGEWQDAVAIVDGTASALKQTKSLMNKKYGFMFTLFGLLGKLRHAEYVSILVDVKK